MAIRMKIPQAAGLRRSVEVQHGAHGLGLMFRRGLHGAKNWALEREEDGSHRSVWAKLFRVAVVLTPLWIVLSAVTGGPQRGGHSAGVGQSLLMALLVLAVGLGVFSARERKLGREEPWADMESNDSAITESEDAEEESPEEVSAEAPTEVLANSQVEDPGSAESRVFHPGENDESEQKTQILPMTVPQATGNKEDGLAVTGLEASLEPVAEEPEQATSESAVDHGVPQAWNTAPEAPTVCLDKATPDTSFQQVKADVQVEWPSVPRADSDGTENLVTESERNDLPDTPTVPFRPPFRKEFPETENAQVEATEEPIRETVQAEFQCLFAEPGPYPDSAEPLTEDWWVVKPDTAAEEPEQNTETENSPEYADDPWAPPQEAVEDGPDVSTAAISPVYPEEVQRYFASRVSVDVKEEEREAARAGVMAWAVAEVTEGRRSQSDVVRMLGVGKATVSRWVNAAEE